MRFFIIAFICTLVLVSYGLVHNQVTIRLSPEYFTLAHPPILSTSSVTLLALAWGILTSVLAGIPFGFLVASASCHGRRLPPIGLSFLRRRLAYLWIGMAIGATLSALGGFFLAQAGVLTLPPDLADLIEPRRHARFLAVGQIPGRTCASRGLVQGAIARSARLELRSGALRRLPGTFVRRPDQDSRRRRCAP